MSHKIKTEEWEKFGTLHVVDDVKDFPLGSVMPLGGDLPENFIVSAYRHLFDENFRPIPEVIRANIRTQYHDSCTGEGLAYQNSNFDRKLSARDCFRQAKRLDGFGVDSYGSTLNASQDAYMNGVATEETVAQPGPEMDRDEYVSLDDVTDEVVSDRQKSKSYYSVGRDQFRQAMLSTDKPVQTSYLYHTGDREMRTNGGVMDMASGSVITGHCQTMFGWIGDRNIFFQSWGPDWGANGLMYVPQEVMVRFGMGKVTIDLPKDLGRLLRQYDGKDVVIDGDFYRCEYAVLRKYPDEITWWAFGNVFGVDVYEIPRADFDAIPKGRDMSIADSPLKTRELVRQIRQHYGQL